MRTRATKNRRPARTNLSERDRLLEELLGLIGICGFDGYLKKLGPVTASAFGYSRREMLSLSMAELVHPDDRARAFEVVGRLRQGETVRGIEMRIRGKDGAYKVILWDAVPSVDEGRFFATGQDITARKNIEDELRESQERFLRICSAANDAVWDWDLRNDRVWRNEAFYQTFGVPDDKKQGTIEWWRGSIHPDDLDRVLASLPPPIVDGKQQWLMEYRLKRQDGTYAQVYDRGFVIFDRDGTPARMVGSVVDITQPKLAEEALRESEERFRLAAKATRDAIWDWDMRRGQVWRSDGFAALFGYEPDNVGTDLDWWIKRTHPDDRERVCAQVTGCTAKSRQYAVEYRFLRGDDTYADVLERGFVMIDADGKPVRMVGSLMDISERRRAEETAQMQQAELAHIARVSTMGEIATGLAHELNQPLAAIANYAESCIQAINSQTADSQPKVLAWVEKIAANTHRAGEIIRRLRGFTRRSELRRATVRVNDLVREVIELVEPETRRRNMRLRWEPAEDASVTVDHVQVQQVLVNLLHNAYEATADQPPERRLVTIGARRRAELIEISVEDQGRGIPAEHRDRVFDAFFTSKANGVGIGLAISRSIVEDHGGRLGLTANPRLGTTFHFTLPISGEENGHVADRDDRG